jgi:AcrR family transcriptional regulator
MDAARELLAELGDQDKLSVRGVTARAGVSANALYLHFADKDALLSAVMIAGYKEMRELLAEAVPDDAEPIEQLRAYGDAYIEFGAANPGLYRVLLMTKIREGVPVPERGGPEGEDEGVDTFNDFLQIVARCLPADADAFTQAAYFWTGLHGRVALTQAIPTFPWPSASEYVQRMIDAHVAPYTKKPRRSSPRAEATR